MSFDREKADATGSPVVCPECNTKFWTPGNLDIALHADAEWRAAFAERIRIEALEQVAVALERDIEYLERTMPPSIGRTITSTIRDDVRKIRAYKEKQ